MKSWHQVLFALVLLLLQVQVLAQVAEMPRPEALKLGDRWEWRQVDSRTKVEEGRPTRTFVSIDGVTQFSYGDSRGKFSAAFVGNPAKKAWRVWPLEVGKKWEHDQDWVRYDGVTGNTRANVSVVAYEEIEVPAGKFMAFKIEHIGSFSNSTGAQGHKIDTFWYAPEAMADVKEIRDDGFSLYTRELVSFKRGAKRGAP